MGQPPRRGSRQSRHSSKFNWYYEMNADPHLKPIIKQILGVLAMKKGNEVELDGQQVVMVKASHSDIAEWTGHHKVTISSQLKMADQGGWIEVYDRGNGAGNRSTYVLTYPEKVSHVTAERLVTSLPKGKPRDYRKVSQNSAKQQVEKSRFAQVLEVPEGTESTSNSPTARSRVTRAPRALARLDSHTQSKAIRCCTDCDDHGQIRLPDADELVVAFEKPGTNPDDLVTVHLGAIDQAGSHHVVACPHGTGRGNDNRRSAASRLTELKAAGYGLVGMGAYLAHDGDPHLARQATDEWLGAEKQWEFDVRQWCRAEKSVWDSWLAAEKRHESDVARWLEAEQAWLAMTQCDLCDDRGFVQAGSSPLALVMAVMDNNKSAAANKLVKDGAARMFKIDLTDEVSMYWLQLVCEHDQAGYEAKIAQLGDDVLKRTDVDDVRVGADMIRENLLRKEIEADALRETKPAAPKDEDDDPDPLVEIAHCHRCDSEGYFLEDGRRILYAAPDGYDPYVEDNPFEIAAITTGMPCDHDPELIRQCLEEMAADGFVKITPESQDEW